MDEDPPEPLAGLRLPISLWFSILWDALCVSKKRHAVSGSGSGSNSS